MVAEELATIVYENDCPTVPVAVRELVIVGATHGGTLTGQTVTVAVEVAVFEALLQVIV